MFFVDTCFPMFPSFSSYLPFFPSYSLLVAIMLVENSPFWGGVPDNLFMQNIFSLLMMVLGIYNFVGQVLIPEKRRCLL